MKILAVVTIAAVGLCLFFSAVSYADDDSLVMSKKLDELSKGQKAIQEELKIIREELNIIRIRVTQSQ